MQSQLNSPPVTELSNVSDEKVFAIPIPTHKIWHTLFAMVSTILAPPTNLWVPPLVE